MKVFEHAFMAVYLLGTLWLIISGFSSVFTKRCVFWIGDKGFDWSGRKAIFGGVLLVVIGTGMFGYAASYVCEQGLFGLNSREVKDL